MKRISFDPRFDCNHRAWRLSRRARMTPTRRRRPPMPAATPPPRAGRRLDHQRADLEQRVGSVEAYIANSDPTAPLQGHQWQLDVNFGWSPSSTQLSTVGHVSRSRPQRLAADQHGAGVVHDAARSGAVLRRPGPQEERAVRARAMLPDHRPGDHPLVYLRLRHDLRRRRHADRPVRDDA